MTFAQLYYICAAYAGMEFNSTAHPCTHPQTLNQITAANTQQHWPVCGHCTPSLTPQHCTRFCHAWRVQHTPGCLHGC